MAPTSWARSCGTKLCAAESLLERAAVADEEDELTGRHVGRNLDGDALDELLARLRADVSLHLDRLAAAHLVAVERDAVERGHAARVRGRDVERDGAQLDALEAARQKRLRRARRPSRRPRCPRPCIEKRRSRVIGSCPFTSILPRTLTVESPRLRSLEVSVL